MASIIELSEEHEKNEELIKSVMNSAADDKHFLKCLDYVRLRETRRNMTHKEVASYFNVSVNTILSWQIQWTQSGLLNRCRRLLAIPASEEVKVANISIMRDWPAILERQRQIATTGKSDKNATDAAKWLFEIIINPAMEASQDPGIEETDYITSTADKVDQFNPHSIQGKLQSSSTKDIDDLDIPE
jgi:hypothetical protein